MTDLLDKVPLARVLEPERQPEPPPDLLLPKLIGAVRAQRRRRAIWLAASGAVAASFVALAIVIGVNQPARPSPRASAWRCRRSSRPPSRRPCR